MLTVFKKLLGSKSERDIKSITPFVDKIKDVYPSIALLSNDALRAKTIEFKEKIKIKIADEENQINELKAKIDINAEVEIDINEKEKIYKRIDELEKESYKKSEEVLSEILPEAFSVVKETARRFKENEVIEVSATEMDRELATLFPNIEIIDDKAFYKNSWIAGGNMITWDMVHYDVQLIGGVVLHQGKIAEMGTGEGKTLVATLPVYLNALTGKGVHIVTVNDYLAKRDSEWMGMIYQFLGLTVDCIDKHQPHSPERQKAYQCDITFGTNNEFGFDYLRDNMSHNIHELVQRKHNFTIVDEVDSVLIDDARTPLIISGPTPKGDQHEYYQLKPFVVSLYDAQKNIITGMLAEAKKLLKEPISKENEKKGSELLFRAYRGLPKNKALIKFLSESGMKTLLQKTENFFMQEQNKNMHIIDDQLYFVIDEKQNSVDLTDKGFELISASVKDHNFFVLPNIGEEIALLERANLTDKEKIQKKNDLLQDYSIKSERVHTINQLLKAYTLFEKDVEYVIMENQVKIVDEQTGRIMQGRRYSDGLHEALEAKEGVKVEDATQTYATITLQNFFRMYSKLAGMTGTAETEAGELWDIYKLDVVVIPTNRKVIRIDYEDLVYKTIREKYTAVINEIVDLVNKGRPVLVGTTSVEISELLSKMLKMRKIKHNVLNAKMHQREADIVAEAGQPGTVTIATNMAGRGTDIKLGPGVKEAGGLAIIGTERHESRRVDRQLRGRAGRQGDPGTSQFFVSLEDELMRLFGSERIARIMDSLGLKEGEVIQHSMITKSIERAQKKVEENNFGIRKRLLEYDDVMNSQRDVVYNRRKHALYGDRLAIDISNSIFDTCEHIIIQHQENRTYDAFKLELIAMYGIDSPFDDKEFFASSSHDLTTQLYKIIYDSYKQKSAVIAEQSFPVIRDIYENSNVRYENIAIPVTDGKKTLQIVVNLKNTYKTKGKEISLAFEKNITLAVIDDAWKEHLREMDDLRQAVQAATYEQKDPLLIYKFESFSLFKKMLLDGNKEIVSFLVKGNIPVSNPQDVQTDAQEEKTDMSKLQTGRAGLDEGHDNKETVPQKTQPIRLEKKVGRNEPCPCGSGKKYKQCHGKD